LKAYEQRFKSSAESFSLFFTIKFLNFSGMFRMPKCKNLPKTKNIDQNKIHLKAFLKDIYPLKVVLLYLLDSNPFFIINLQMYLLNADEHVRLPYEVFSKEFFG